MRHKFTFGMMGLLALTAVSAPTKKNYSPTLVQRQDDGTLKPAPVAERGPASEYFGNRVYFVYSPTKDRMVLALTDTRGNFRTPFEAIGTGTVLRGEQLGANKPLAHFLLSNQGKWVPTKLGYRLISLSLDGSTPLRIESEERAELKGAVVPPSALQFKDG